MKRVLLVSAFAVLALASCKKDYTCDCVSSINGVEYSTSTSVIHSTKKKATDTCTASSTSSTSGGSTVTTTCTIN